MSKLTRGDPFALDAQSPSGASWRSNNLLLQDPALRAKAGVDALDRAVTDVYTYSRRASAPSAPGGKPAAAPTAQAGGAAFGVPFYMQYPDSHQAKPYPQDAGVSPQGADSQSGGGMPHRYYNNNTWW